VDGREVLYWSRRAISSAVVLKTNHSSSPPPPPRWIPYVIIKNLWNATERRYGFFIIIIIIITTFYHDDVRAAVGVARRLVVRERWARNLATTLGVHAERNAAAAAAAAESRPRVWLGLWRVTLFRTGSSSRGVEKPGACGGGHIAWHESRSVLAFARMRVFQIAVVVVVGTYKLLLCASVIIILLLFLLHYARVGIPRPPTTHTTAKRPHTHTHGFISPTAFSTRRRIIVEWLL